MLHTEDLRIERPRPDAAVVVLLGEHDIATSARLERLLASLMAENDLVVVDVSEVKFIDSSVINSLVETNRMAAAQPCLFKLQVGTEAIVHRALEITGVLRLIDWAPTRDQALNGRPRGS